MKKLLLILILPVIGCSSISEMIYPTPDIDKEAKYRLFQDKATHQISLRMQVGLENTEQTVWYYGCERKEVEWYEKGDAAPVRGNYLTHQTPLIDCWSTLIIRMEAYNRWQKKGQKSAAIHWKINVKEILNGNQNK